MKMAGTPNELVDKIKLYALKACLFFEQFDDIMKKDESEDEVKIRVKNSIKELQSKAPQSLKSLENNINALKKTLKLNKTECKIVEFAIFINEFQTLRCAFRRIEDIHFVIFCDALAFILNEPVNAIKSALSPLSNLNRARILKVDFRRSIDLDRAFEFFYSYFSSDMLLNDEGDIRRVFKSSFFKSEKSTLKFSDFSHVKVDEKLIKSLIFSGKKAINILLYGLPDTGKTEFARMIANECKRDIYEIAFQSRYLKDEYSGLERFNALDAADKILNAKKDIIMFDEIEDVFKGRRISKALFNSVLENNLTPTFWITNDINEIDNAYIRRFDMVIEFCVPPRAKRFEILSRYANAQISQETIKKLSKNKLISPALISNAAKVVSFLGEEQNDKIFKNLIKSSLKAQGFIAHKKAKKDKQKIELPQSYDAKFINANSDLNALANGIKESKNARICLYGAAGTSKSAYAKFIAKTLKSEIIIKKSSDLIDAYVGNTEKNIVHAFKEAKEKNAVLVFDEVDSFLQDRNDAVRSWEISCVNEMLTQMESFNGVFIATTNLLNRLDSASLRRFDLKIEFGFLKGKQAVNLFKKECEILGLNATKTALNLINDIKILTPGDFAAVLRANKFSPIKSADEFSNHLKDEIKYKEQNQNEVGFRIKN